MLNGFSGAHRQELQKTLENALRELRTEEPPTSQSAESTRPTDSAYSSSVSSRAASSSNPQEVEQAAAAAAPSNDGKSEKEGAKVDANGGGKDGSTW